MLTVIRKLLTGLVILFCANVQAFVEVTSFEISERANTADVDISLRTTDPTPPSSIIPSVFVDYTTVDGTATDENTDNDYRKASGKLEFTSFETQTVHVQIVNDSEIEGPEAFSVDAAIGSAPTMLQQLSPAGSLKRKQPVIETAPASSGTIGIADDDTTVEVRVNFPPTRIPGGSSVDVNVTLVCSSGSIDPPPLGETSATKMTVSGVALFELINFLPGVACVALQPDGPPPGYEQISTNCDPNFSSGNAVCTVTNVPIGSGPQPIPVLDKYGLMLLILLMLGFGVVGVRRFF